MTALTQLSVKTPAVATRPEVELLLCCARTSVDSERAERIRTVLQENIDWAYLIQTAVHHGVMPLLYWNLNATCSKAIPKTILAQLRDCFHTNAQRNWFLTGELLKLLNLFEAHGIPAIPFKGPVLAASAYGNLALRQFCDLDILVHQLDVPRARNLLISQEYQLQGEQDWEHQFFNKDSGVNVELHHAIAPSYFNLSLDFEDLWSRRKPVTVAGTMVDNLLPEDLLLILCVQWCRDCCIGRERLAQLCDVAELLSTHQYLDWSRVMEQARTLSCERMLFLYLLLVSDFLGTALPAPVCQRMQADPVLNSLAMPLRQWLFSEADEPKLLGTVEGIAFWIGIRERLGDRVRHFFALMHCTGWMSPNERDHAFLPLPASLSFLYYVVRPIRVVGKYGLSPLKRRLGF